MATCAILLTTPAIAQYPGSTQRGEQRSEDRPDPALVDTIIVTARSAAIVAGENIEPPEQIALPADAASIAARTAGGALVGNGALSGQLSYRGLTGERVLSRINGPRFASGGPNAMDPPLHYAPSILVGQIEVTRGVAPVSDGPSLAAAVNAKLVETQFAAQNYMAVQGRFAAQYRSVDDSYAVGSSIGLADDRWRFGMIASREEGKDYDFPGGHAGGTSFERSLYGAHAGFRAGPGELFIEYRRSETDPTGNPPFALDIVYFDTDFLQGGFRGEIADNINLDLRLGHVTVRHLMDNQTIREPAAPAMSARATFADADTSIAEAALRFGSQTRYVSLGTDAEIIDKFVTITNPNNAAFYIDAQPILQSRRVGGFVEWRSGAGPVEFKLGARIDHTAQSAGIPQIGAAVPIGPRGLAAAFVRAKREQGNTTSDFVLQAWLPSGEITPRLTLARKTRVPSLLERYAWLPTEASYGLADGNIYVGNLALNPEDAWSAEFGVDFENGMGMVRPTVFYKRIDGYIQGVPYDSTVGIIDTAVEMVAAINGDTTPLTFGNVDAQLYGVDLDFRLQPIARLEIEGTASFVRGKRRDIDDDLYRISPANVRVSAAWRGDHVTLGTELFAAAKQGKVSATNSEDSSPAYAVVGVFGHFAASEKIRLEAGIENIFDTWYQPHLAGRNRVGASDVLRGERIPGPGRGAWVRIAAQF